MTSGPCANSNASSSPAPVIFRICSVCKERVSAMGAAPVWHPRLKERAAVHYLEAVGRSVG